MAYLAQPSLVAVDEYLLAGKVTSDLPVVGWLQISPCYLVFTDPENIAGLTLGPVGSVRIEKFFDVVDLPPNAISFIAKLQGSAWVGVLT